MIKNGNIFGHPYMSIRLKFSGVDAFSTFMDGYAIHSIKHGGKVSKIRDFNITAAGFNEKYVRHIIDQFILNDKET